MEHTNKHLWYSDGAPKILDHADLYYDDLNCAFRRGDSRADVRLVDVAAALACPLDELVEWKRLTDGEIAVCMDAADEAEQDIAADTAKGDDR